MAKQLLFESPVVKFYHDTDLSGLYALWDGTPTAEQWIEAIKKQIEILGSKKLSTIYADITKLGMVPQEGQEWVNKVGWAQYKTVGLKKMALLIAESAIAQMTVENMTEESGGIVTKYFSVESNALAWLKS